MAAPPVMVTADDVSQGKPHPEPFLVAARQLQVEPLDCVALEDSPAGVTAAREAGMRVIAVSTTYPAEHLAHASLVLPQLPEARADTTRSVIELRSSSLIPGTGVEAP
jgi:sugar-phosphatase